MVAVQLLLHPGLQVRLPLFESFDIVVVGSKRRRRNHDLLRLDPPQVFQPPQRSRVGDAETQPVRSVHSARRAL
jgi:hypothetical protein